MATPAAEQERDRRRRRALWLWFVVAALLVGGLGSWGVVELTRPSSDQASRLNPDGPEGQPTPSASPAPGVALGTPAPVVGSGSYPGTGAPGSGGMGSGHSGTGSPAVVGQVGNPLPVLGLPLPPGHAIKVSGAVTGEVGPGRPATLVVTIRNPNNQDILVTSVTGKVTTVATGSDATKQACQVSWYSIGSFAGSQRIARNSTAAVSLPVTLADLPGTNQDNCKGASYTFTFQAQARQA
jgi:hypothetical protein